MRRVRPGESGDANDRESSSTRDAPTWGEVPQLSAGETIARYVLLHRLGGGAMGVVHAAYDPKLDRKIALKLLAPQRTHRFRDALLAEAQAMAKLTHPNVVAVHDVGTHGDRVFIAMEYVPGRTLR